MVFTEISHQLDTGSSYVTASTLKHCNCSFKDRNSLEGNKLQSTVACMSESRYPKNETGRSELATMILFNLTLSWLTVATMYQ